MVVERRRGEVVMSLFDEAGFLRLRCSALFLFHWYGTLDELQN